MAKEPVWKKNAAGVYEPLWIERGAVGQETIEPAWAEDACEIACCEATSHSCSECIANASGVGATISGYPSAFDCNEGCPWITQWRVDALNGGWAATEGGPGTWTATYGEKGNAGNPGIFISRTRPGISCTQLFTYIWRATATASCTVDTLYLGWVFSAWVLQCAGNDCFDATANYAPFGGLLFSNGIGVPFGDLCNNSNGTVTATAEPYFPKTCSGGFYTPPRASLRLLF